MCYWQKHIKVIKPMKRIILLVCIQIVSLSLLGNFIDEHKELVNNFETLVNYNKENNNNDNSHLNKYIMVHTPGPDHGRAGSPPIGGGGRHLARANRAGRTAPP